MEPTALEGLLGSLLVVEVSLHHGVATRNNLAHRLPIFRDVIHILVHDPCEARSDMSLALTSEQLGLLFPRQLAPLRVPLTDSVWPIGFGEPVEVDASYVQALELREKCRRWRRAPDR